MTFWVTVADYTRRETDPWENRTPSDFLHSIFQGFQLGNLENSLKGRYWGTLKSCMFGPTHLFGCELTEGIGYKGEEEKRG